MRLRLARAEIASSLAGQSPRWMATLAAIEREAAAETPVLLTGEAGTEKEAAARALDRLSRRGSEPFVTVLAESKLPPESGAGGTLYLPDVERTSPRGQKDPLPSSSFRAGAGSSSRPIRTPRCAGGGPAPPEI
jgi:transcriptional regulator of aromatic amino acid metabolism